MKKKLLTFLFSSVIAISMLAGCSSNAGNSEEIFNGDLDGVGETTETDDITE